MELRFQKSRQSSIFDKMHSCSSCIRPLSHVRRMVLGHFISRSVGNRSRDGVSAGLQVKQRVMIGYHYIYFDHYCL